MFPVPGQSCAGVRVAPPDERAAVLDHRPNEGNN